jgi:uncharacterized protein
MRTFLLCAVLLIIDLYVLQGIRVLSRDLGLTAQRTLFTCYWLITVFCLGVLITSSFIDWHTWPKVFRTYSFAFIFICYFSKLFIIIFLLVDDISRFFRWIYSMITNKDITENDPVPSSGSMITRSDFLIKTGLIIGSVPFFSLIYGLLGGAYNFRIKKLNLRLKNLPPAFDGFKVLQISDIHSGSFNSGEPLEKAAEMIMKEKADVIFFTGDLVNNKSDEAEPYISILQKIKAPYGVYSTFGNHDYGDYVQWESAEAKAGNLEKLKRIHSSLGWNLLFDDHAYLEKDEQRIGVIGIQNWSAHLRFPKYGSMEKAVRNFTYAPVNILLSHDPSHWKAEVLDKYPNVDLMLAGHTHGFQFGIEIPGIKWSPVQYVYKEWAGLYSEGERHLYVNRGLGFLGYPGRVGILPEITVITLNKG